MKKLLSKNKGFTLIEVLVALAIFTSSVIALMSVASTGLSNANYAKSRFIASYLAQEGIELTRNIRDNAGLSGALGSITLQTFFTNNGCLSANGCFIDPMPTTLSASACTQADCSDKVLLYDQNSGFYNYTVGNLSAFTRQIKVTVSNPSQPDEVTITSTVYWLQGSVPKSVSYSEDIFNWIQ